MWKVAIEDSERTDSLSEWSAWLLILCQGSANSPLTHICSPHTRPATVFLLHFPDCLLLLRRGNTGLQRPRVPCRVQGWTSLQNQGEPPTERQTVPLCQAPLPWTFVSCVCEYSVTLPFCQSQCIPWWDPQQIHQLHHRKAGQRLLWTLCALNNFLTCICMTLQRSEGFGDKQNKTKQDGLQMTWKLCFGSLGWGKRIAWAGVNKTQ